LCVIDTQTQIKSVCICVAERTRVRVRMRVIRDFVRVAILAFFEIFCQKLNGLAI
jgi:hypothetical protein